MYWWGNPPLSKPAYPLFRSSSETTCPFLHLLAFGSKSQISNHKSQMIEAEGLGVRRLGAAITSSLGRRIVCLRERDRLFLFPLLKTRLFPFSLRNNLSLTPLINSNSVAWSKQTCSHCQEFRIVFTAGDPLVALSRIPLRASKSQRDRENR